MTIANYRYKYAPREAIACLVIAMLFTGCAAPIKSRSETAAQQAMPLEGLQYFLTSASVEIPIAIRLENCGITSTDGVGSKPPRMTLLRPLVNQVPLADSEAAFVLSPKDAWNLFRAIEVTDITLTKDGRIASAASSVTDKTVEVLVDALKAIAGGPLAAFAAPIPRIVPGHCTEIAEEAVNAVFIAKKELEDLQRASRTLLTSNTYGVGFDKTLATLNGAIDAQGLKVASLQEKVTKRGTLALTPSHLSSHSEAVVVIDIGHHWIRNSERENCTALKATELAKQGDPQLEGWMNRSLNLTSFRDCVVARAQFWRTTTQSDASRSAMATVQSGASGIVYRLPAEAGVTLEVQRTTGGARSIILALESADATNEAKPARSDELAAGAKAVFAGLSATVPQWGRLAVMPSDVGFLTTNAVKTTFDEWGVPKTASWSASPVNIPGLLGVVNQADSVFNKKTPAPDPAAKRQTEVLLRLLQICKDAPLTAIPDFCAGLVK